MVYIAMLICAALIWFLYRTRSPDWCCARWAKAPNRHTRWATRYGAFAWRLWWQAVPSVGWRAPTCQPFTTPLWVEGMIAGKGWIALALTTFATWRPARVLLGAYLFGGVTMMQFHLQSIGVSVPTQFLTMLPYLATIVVLVLISRNPLWIRVNMPTSIGKPFYPGS